MDYDLRAQTQAGAKLALKANGGKGQVVTLTHQPISYDPTAGTNSGSPIVQTGSGCVFEYNTFIRSGIQAEPATLVQAGGRRLLLSPFASDGTMLTAPMVGDTVTIAGTTYEVSSVSTFAPAGAVIFYECNIRGPG